MTDVRPAPSLSQIVDHENTTFTVEGMEGSPVELRLSEITTRSDTDDWEQFSLWFETTDDTELTQALYRLDHPELGEFDLTMTPVATVDPERQQFQAVFDRPVDGGDGETSDEPRRLAAGQADSDRLVGSTAPYIGEISIFAGNYAIEGFAFCNGTQMVASQHAALFSLLGSTYGGDGRTTFRLPDLGGRVPLHMNQQYRLGQQGGTADVPLSNESLPAHTHGLSSLKLPVSTEEGDKKSPDGNHLAHVPAASPITDEIYNSDANPQGSMSLSGEQTDSTGSGGTIPNMQPYLALNYLISTTGTYPPRSQ